MGRFPACSGFADERTWHSDGERMMRSRANDEAMAEMYRDDPAFALMLVNSILEDGDEWELQVVSRQILLAIRSYF
jgi:hypothetical protein